MTEDEAKTKTCHKTLAAIVMPHNSRVEFNPRPCIGSACMAWLWFLGSSINERATGGYCGLVGKQ